MIDERMREFLEKNRSAAMTTLRADGTPHTVRVGAALVDGKLWSSGTQTRLRTKFLRRDPRSTLFVFESQFEWLSLECTVSILEGPDAAELSLRLFQVMQRGMGVPEGQISWYGRPLTHDEFRKTMVEEQRLIYEFDVVGAYGMY